MYPLLYPTHPDVGLMLGQRLRRWLNNKPASGLRLVCVGYDSRS